MSLSSERPLKLLLLNEFFYPDRQGGTATATANLARALHDSGIAEVSVLTGQHAYRENKRYAAKEDWRGIDIRRAPAPNWLRKRMLQRLAGNVLFALSAALKSMRMSRPDVVVVTTAPLTMPITASFLRKFRKVPYVYVIYDLDPDRTVALKHQSENSRQVRILRGYQRRWLQNSGAVVAIGRCMRDTVIERYQLDPKQVHVVEVGADPNVVSPGPRATQFRKVNGLNEFIVLYSGNLGQYHDFDTLLDAAQQIRDTNPDIKFVIVGTGHKRDHILAEMHHRHLTNMAMFPFVDEEHLADLLASADVHLVTLEAGMEGLCVPSKFYTCLASGRPVLALVPETSEVAYVLEEGKCGVHVHPGDPSALAQAVVGLRESADLSEMGERARKTFEDRFTISQTSQRLATAIRAAIDRKA